MDKAEWLKKRTFHHRDFADIRKLVELKEKQNLTISVGFPTLNVVKTLPAILQTIKTSLMEKYPLVDEIAIVDSRSKDKTTNVAKRYGVDVYYDDEVLPSLGTAKGKGEALWKSLAALKGDIICWVDSDIENIHPRFVYGLVGPLLTNKNIGYIKGFYQRPVKEDGKLKPSGGGRVTEILARPLLNLFYPELAGIIQPLAGEYAGRREVLESAPFFTGYAVETALNIEIFRQFGLSRMAQVDLEKRVHHNQTTEALGRMAFGILEGVLVLLEKDKKLKLKTALPQVMQTVGYKNKEHLFSKHKIEIIERPPMKTIAEYKKIRKELEKSDAKKP